MSRLGTGQGASETAHRKTEQLLIRASPQSRRQTVIQLAVAHKPRKLRVFRDDGRNPLFFAEMED